MSKPISIDPFWIPSESRFGFRAEDMNSFQRATLNDTLGFYQRVFNIYGFMKMNSQQKYVVYSPKSTPLKWQPYNTCSYNETNSLEIGMKELTPDRVYMKEGWCHDELFGTAMQHLIRFGENGGVGLDAEGQQVFSTIAQEIVTNATLGLRLGLTVGQMFDVNAVTYDAGLPTDTVNLFKATHATTQGWVKLMADLATSDAAAYGHLNITSSNLDSASVSASGEFTGDIINLFEELKAAAKKPLRKLIDRGGIISANGLRFYPLFVVSDSVYASVVAYYNAESTTTATNRMRITRRDFGQVDGTPMPATVYFIDDRIPIVPLEDISGYDEYLKGDTHFAGIVASGNIQMGMSFETLPADVENTRAGVMISQVTDPTRNDFGKFHFLSHGLVKSAIADTDYAVGVQLYTEPV